ncbi:MAG: lipoyl(octanoyl) transferase LipB [Bacteroidales bacterium]|nr:lipoyl(octanoyl) transferase LipB [Bacteroidales bacterium]
MNYRITYFQDLELIEYKKAWDYQEELFNENLEKKTKNLKLPSEDKIQIKNFLLFCEHPHVFTLGKSGLEANLLIKKENLISKGVSFFKTNRGGDITYHGPGQIVAYPIIDLENFSLTLRKYIFGLEEAIIKTLDDYDISASRFKGATGVWLDATIPHKARKICAIGVRSSRWITMHGFAFNVNTDLNYYNYINPCGFTDKAVTSMEKELGAKQNLNEVKQKLKSKLVDQFGMKFIQA